MVILGIETSCDETACGIVESVGPGQPMRLLSNAVLSSMDLQAVYGGVVPEIAARSHIEAIIPVIQQALNEAFPTLGGRTSKSDKLWNNIDGISVTYGAGLSGSLLVGVMTARTLAITKSKPLYAINHVEAHIYANFITEIAASSQLSAISYQLPAATPQFPMLGLIVSGGHSQLVLWRNHFDYTLLGQTQDDAIGEAFDKVAKILGLPYPGGPRIEELAKQGDPFAFKFPKAKMPGISPALAELRRVKRGERREEKPELQPLHSSLSTLPSPPTHGYDYSFSGPKTAVLRAAQELIGETHEFASYKLAERLSEAQKANIAASFQRIAVETVVDKTMLAYEEFKPKSVVIGGGVASSPELRRQLADRLPIEISYTDRKLCTDNGAMIAVLGCFKAMLGQPKADPYSLGIAPNLSM